jgi:hypothetical protein
MDPINEEIKECLHSVLRNKLSIKEFEQWLYDKEEILEESLGKDVYFRLINLNYNSKYVMDELEEQLTKILNYKSVEEFKIKDLLYRFVYIEDEFISSCSQIYREYCNGYSFFRMIALIYIVFDYDNQLADPVKRSEFLRQNREELLNEGLRLLCFFNALEIEIIGENEYVDKRHKDQKVEEQYWT